MSVAVIGAGIAGLAAAHALAEAGEAVTVLERDAVPGGVVRTARAGGFLLEAGPESFLTTKPEALELCHALGLADRIVHLRPGLGVGVWARPGLIPLPAGIRLLPTRIGPLLRSPLFSAREKVRMAADLVLPRASGAGDETLGSLVRRRLGQAALDRLAAPLVAGIYAADPDSLSLEATFPHLLAAEREAGSLIRGLAARAPAPGPPPFATLADGLGTLIDGLVARIGPARIRTGTTAAALEATEGGYAVRLADGETVPAAAVVVAVAPHAAARLLAGLAPAAAEALESIPSVSTAVVSLGYRAAEIPPLEGSGFVVARDRPAAITGCTWSSSKWPGRAPEGHALLRAYLGSAVAPLDPGAADGTLVEAVRRDLEAAMDLRAEPVLTRVDRWPRAMPQYRPGHRARLAAIEAALERHPRIALAGSGYRGVGIPDCIAQGRAAAERVAAGPLPKMSYRPFTASRVS